MDCGRLSWWRADRGRLWISLGYRVRDHMGIVAAKSRATGTEHGAVLGVSGALRAAGSSDVQLRTLNPRSWNAQVQAAVGRSGRDALVVRSIQRRDSSSDAVAERWSFLVGASDLAATAAGGREPDRAAGRALHSMIGSRIPPVVATNTAAGLARGAVRRVTPGLRIRVTDAVTQHCDGRVSVLTDGATSALAHALRMAAGPNRVVALPGFGCVDLVAAAVFANVSVVTYDIDPATLSPDLDSVRRAVADGIGALVIAPLFGFPVDVEAVRSITTPAGVTVIEDAAQGAGGTWRGRRIGALGDVVVLSFGRGKGTSAGRGGALISRHADFDAPVRDLAATLPAADAGWRDWMVSAAVWALARPALYAIPSSIPSLRLGEMVFHEAHAPRAMGNRAVAMLPDALSGAESAAAERRVVAIRLLAALERATGIFRPTPLLSGRCGWLRFPLLVAAGRGAAPALGILRSYPVPVRAMQEGRAVMRHTHASEPGADQLARTLVTVPTHRFVTQAVIEQISTWASF